MSPKPARPVLLLAAFAAVYLLWGSAYLAMNSHAIVTMPPFLMAGSRFLLAGSILALVGRASADYETPTLAQWKTSFVVGALLLLGGNGMVVLAERQLPSSLAALLIASEPFWVVLPGLVVAAAAAPQRAGSVGSAAGLRRRVPAGRGAANGRCRQRAAAGRGPSVAGRA